MRLAAPAIAAAALVAAAPAFAVSLVVDNASFETLPPGGLIHCDGAGTGCFSTGYDAPIPGWSGNLTSGQFQPLTPQLNYIPDGATVAYSNGGTITQIVAATAVAGQTYTLRVDLGFRKDVTGLGFAYLAIGPFYGPGMVLASAAPAPQYSGDWLTYSARYTATAADAGQAIGIMLGAAGVQGDFDNVRLDATAAVPEPAAWALMVGGFAAVGAARRRQKTFCEGTC